MRLYFEIVMDGFYIWWKQLVCKHESQYHVQELRHRIESICDDCGKRFWHKDP